MPRGVKGAMDADDLVLWCNEEYNTTANFILREALNQLEKWTKNWAVRCMQAKQHTLFSLFQLKGTKNYPMLQ